MYLNYLNIQKIYLLKQVPQGIMEKRGKEVGKMKKPLFLLLVVITTALMGSSFAIGKIGLNYVSSFLLVGLRFTIAGLIMSLILIKRPKPKEKKNWLRIGLIGFFQTTGVMGAIFLSLQTITAGESSILTFLNPLLVVVFGSTFLKLKYHFSQWMGVILGFIGVFITMGFHLQFKVGTIYGFGAAISWAIATLLVKRWGYQLDVWILSAYQMLFGGIGLLISSFLLEDPKFIPHPIAFGVVLWLAIMASIVQFTIWFYLLHKNDPAKVSAFLFLAPFFGVLSGWMILKEPISLSLLFGGSFILLGIFLVNWPRPTKDRIFSIPEVDTPQVTKSLN